MFNMSLRDAAQPGHGRRPDDRRRGRQRGRQRAPTRTAPSRSSRTRAARRRAERPRRERAVKVTPEPPRAAHARADAAAPLSQTIWTGRAAGTGASASRDGASARRRPTTDTRSRPRRSPSASGSCPATTCSTRPCVAARGQQLDHARNIRIIEEKLASFQIPASVAATNTGPVVTQYEVKPDARVKLSRIEGLADDLAMALAARSIRIEAPIPGRDVVGIEIPNHSSEIVGFRQLLEDARHERRDQQADLRPRAATCRARRTRSTWRACPTC